MSRVLGTTDLTDNGQSLKAWMLQKLKLLGEATAATWEQAVFQGLTGRTRHDVDWSDEDNQTGYGLWISIFGKLAGELVAEGAVTREMRSGRAVLVATPQPEGSVDLH
jgi:hypothetical protein